MSAQTGRNPSAGILLVANKGDNSLGIIDPVAGRQVAEVAEGGVTGHEVAASPDGRLAYVPIHRRPALHLPNDARVAVWTIVNVENWSPTGAMPRAVLPPPMGQPLLPDVPNWS